MEAIINTLNLILLIAVILIFWRLRGVLGLHADSDAAGRDMFGGKTAKAASKDKSKDKDKTKKAAKPPLRVVSDGENARASDGLSAIAQMDRGFDTAAFLDGAAAAYEVIVPAFAAHDRDTLRPLISREVMAGFDEVMQAREKREQVLQSSLLKLAPPTIYDAVLDGTKARVTVQFESEIMSVLRDKQGAVADGSPQRAAQHRDLWTFERDVKSRSPSWVLVATASL